MQVLLCAATELEIKPIIEFLKEKGNPSVDILITGVGILSATYSITRAVMKDRPDFIIQAGVAGALNETLQLGTICTVGSEALGDLGVMEEGEFHSVFDLKLADKNADPFVGGKLINRTAFEHKWELNQVNGLTVNEITTGKERINFYREKYQADIESMEGAALHFIGNLEDIRYLQLRALSNYIGERDKKKWLLKEAINELNKELERLLNKLEVI